ncbi:integrase [Pandoraea pnomenusa]|nr:integrase [Pandoraea pnomenusa]
MTFGAAIKALIQKSLPFGYRTVAYPLGFNEITVRRVFRLMGW